MFSLLDIITTPWATPLSGENGLPSMPWAEFIIIIVRIFEWEKRCFMVERQHAHTKSFLQAMYNIVLRNSCCYEHRTICKTMQFDFKSIKPLWHSIANSDCVIEGAICLCKHFCQHTILWTQHDSTSYMESHTHTFDAGGDLWRFRGTIGCLRSKHGTWWRILMVDE